LKPDPVSNPADIFVRADNTVPAEADIREGGRRIDRGHLAALDGLRGAAALYVLLHHLTTYLPYPNANIAQRIIGTTFRFGHYPVDVFIVLSGFCLMIPVCRSGGTLKGGSRHFFVRRARRILPTYYAAVLVSLLLIGTILGSSTGTPWDQTMPLTWTDVVSHLFLFQDLLPNANHHINYAMWSISVEWRIYFLFPLLIVAAARMGTPAVAILTTLLSYLVLFLLRFTPINTGAWGASPAYFGLFSIGMLACDLSFGKLREFTPNRSIFLAFIGVGTIALAILSFSRYSGHLQALSLLVGLIGACLMLCMIRGYLPAVSQIFSWRPLAFLGTMGFSLYLFHPPIIQLVWIGLIRPLNLSIQAQQMVLVASAPLVVAGCYLAFLAFEKPVLRSLARKK
jgi:peptidoglycan/LPS O-acetylase OafA/YrhL